MAEQNQKIVIVVGAGASADFVVPNIVDFGQNHGRVKYEIWDNLDYNTNHIQGKLHYKKDPRKHFLVEKFTGNYAFPSGESLIKLIANQEKILQLLKNLSLDRLLPYLFISYLVAHYQPFSIDELLDSINRNKVGFKKTIISKKLNILEALKFFHPNQVNSKRIFVKKVLDKNLKKELIEAGKTLIAIFLLRSEKKELFENVGAKIWYRHVRNFIISGKDDKEIEKNIENLTIISFNYDRSLDYYLRTRLQKYYNKIKDRIIYPYGKLAKDNWEEVEDYGDYSTNGKIAPYDKEKIEYFKKLGNNLKVIGELEDGDFEIDEQSFNNELNEHFNKIFQFKQGLDYFNATKLLKKKLNNYNLYTKNKAINDSIESHLSKDAQELNIVKELIISLDEGGYPLIKNFEDQIILIIQKLNMLKALFEADKLYFLGFAFHKQNCDLLWLNYLLHCKNQKRIYYTNYDESSSLEEVVSDIFPDDKFTLHPSVRKGVYDALIYDFRLG